MSKPPVRISPKTRDHGRWPRTSKHARGKVAKPVMGLTLGQPQSERAFFKPTNRDAAKRSFLAQSAAQGNAIAKEKADARAYRRWYESLSPADQAFAREHKLDKPMPESGFRRSAGSEDALDVAEREIVPEADIRGSRNGRPIVAVENSAIDAMEPQTLSVEVESLSDDEVRTAAEDFGDALRWALAPSTFFEESSPEHHLVQLGKRSAVLIAGMRSDLAAGFEIDRDLARSFLDSYGNFRLTETLQRLQETGAIYSRFLEWMRRASSLSELGENLQVVAYSLRPDLIDASTLAELGAAKNKTRQAKDKAVNCLRDTFPGMRALAMRSDTTRLLCKRAQLQPA